MEQGKGEEEGLLQAEQLLLQQADRLQLPGLQQLGQLLPGQAEQLLLPLRQVLALAPHPTPMT
jgi:hypothetical protein